MVSGIQAEWQLGLVLGVELGSTSASRKYPDFDIKLALNGVVLYF